jgi:hypothetical protein
LNPSSLAFSSLISKQAEAPSVCSGRDGEREGGRKRERERKKEVKNQPIKIATSDVFYCILATRLSTLSTARDLSHYSDNNSGCAHFS